MQALMTDTGDSPENSLCHCSLFAFSGLFLCFELHSILYFICMLFFCSSADHSSALFEVNEQKTASAAFCFFLFSICFSLYSISILCFNLIGAFACNILLISQSFQCMVCGKWVENCLCYSTCLNFTCPKSETQANILY